MNKTPFEELKRFYTENCNYCKQEEMSGHYYCDFKPICFGETPCSPFDEAICPLAQNAKFQQISDYLYNLDMKR